MTYYDERYWEYQKEIGVFGGKANIFKFEKYIKASDDIADFGCGGGYLLDNIQSSGKKIGIDINAAALEHAKELGVECYTDVREVPEGSCDIVVSNHCLEHVENPVYYLKELKRIVRPGGKIVIVVPHEISEKINPKDPDHHIYTWSPQNLKNLFLICGISVEECGRINHTWFPKCRMIQKYFGWKVFHTLCRVWSRVVRRYQTYAVGIVRL